MEEITDEELRVLIKQRIADTGSKYDYHDYDDMIECDEIDEERIKRIHATIKVNIE